MADLWSLACERRDDHVFSTLFSADRFDRILGSPIAVDAAIDWCRATGVTKVYLENFRTDREVPVERIEPVKLRFEQAGIETAGGITPTRLGRNSTGWDLVSCYTDRRTQERLQHVCEQAARLFDLVMIDDFLFTDCTCADCTAARAGRSWSLFRRDMMLDIAQNRILEPARRVNPNVRFILKYPQWYDLLHERGYDVDRQTQLFDLIWAGTELRDPARTTGSLPVVEPYEGFFMMRWVTELGGRKCGGGWFDALATSPPAYLEQAWQTILGGARESMLFDYAGLTGDERSRADVAALRQAMPTLLDLAALIRTRPVRGIACPKPPNSTAGDGRYLYDHAGMLGLPLAPTVWLDPAAPAAFVSAENLADPNITPKLNAMLEAGKPVVATDGLLSRAPDVRSDAPTLLPLAVHGNPPSLLKPPPAELDAVRRHLGTPFGFSLTEPTRVAVNLFGDDIVAVSNFNDEPVQIGLQITHRQIDHCILTVTQPGWAGPGVDLNSGPEGTILTIPPRSLAVVATSPTTG